MSVKFIGEKYEFPAANRRENYGDDIVVYICWKHHVGFHTGAPAYRISPETKLRDFLELVRSDYGVEPAAAKIVWEKAEWTYEGKPWKAQLDKTIAENGLSHMAFLWFRTPELPGWEGKFKVA